VAQGGGVRQGTGEPEWLFPESRRLTHEQGLRRRRLSSDPESGLPHYRVYDLRHTFASLLLAESARITCISAQLGHSSQATTMRLRAPDPEPGKAMRQRAGSKDAAERVCRGQSGTRAGGI
jgi:integrase